jgi:hypothetical protein
MDSNHIIPHGIAGTKSLSIICALHLGGPFVVIFTFRFSGAFGVIRTFRLRSPDKPLKLIASLFGLGFLES